MNIENITSDGMSLSYNGLTMQKNVYEQEIERLNKALQDIKDFIDKHTKIIKETNTKYLLTNVKDDNILIDIVNKALGSE